MIVLGITGQPASGKDTIADYLIDRGFTKYTMGDIIRAEMRAIGLPLDRPSMSKFIEKKKREAGLDYICKIILTKLEDKTVVPGIRSTEEVKTFRKELGGQFTLIAVQTHIERRHKWATERNREGDQITLEQFKAQEDRERDNYVAGQEVDRVVEMADYVIDNDGTREDLYKKVDELIRKLS
ncbi:MAG: AAA family ATPase [Minisyncoccia bacterium]